MTDTASIRREMADARTEMAQTADALKERASEKVRAVKGRLDVAQVIREHPWPALGAAVVLGAVIGQSGADETAASATATAAKRASLATAGAAKLAVKKVRRRDPDDNARPHVASEPVRPGFMDRLFDGLGLSVASGIDRVLDEMRVASRDWGTRMASSSRPSQPVSARAPQPVTPPATTSVPVAAAAPVTALVVVEEQVVTSPAAADEIPVPNEMPATELDARADAVEALGGGTNEPPLAPGAGDLGARWA
jgi:hypothetical protein